MSGEGRFCINCKLRGHAACDRACPVFVDKFERMTTKIPDNQYKFFPIANDAASWECTDGTLNPNYTMSLPPERLPLSPTA